MNYSDPRLRDLLAGQYVLGTLPRRARLRFEALMRFDAGLARLVGDWAERLGALDRSLTPVTPPGRVWRAIEARTASTALRQGKPRRDPLAWWRGWAIGASAVAVALVVLIVSMPMPNPSTAPTQVVAVLSDKDGKPGWIVSSDQKRQTYAVEAVRPIPVDAQHAFELWVIDTAPHPLGVIAAEPAKRVTIPGTSVPKTGHAMAVSLEPPGGSTTGAPTGPVLYQGLVIED